VFRFDRGAEGEVKLLARWTITKDNEETSLITRRTMIIEPTPPDSEAEAVIVALSRAVESLGREIARDLQGLAGQAATSSTSIYDVTRIQNSLRVQGYDPGPADGVVGPRTRAAIRRYQADQGAKVTGEPSRRLQDMLTRS
jgi:murein L,D-transpeptidase YcbB/YkuD